MKVVSINICGLVDPIKQQQVRQIIATDSIDILLLQETNITNSNLPNFQFKIPNHKIFNNPGPHRGSGLLTIFSNTFPTTVTHTIVFEGYISAFIFVLEHKKFILINSYIPNEQDLAKGILEVLKEYLTPFRNDIIIMGGDFNCTLEPFLDRTSGVEFHNISARTLLDLTEEFDLVDAFRGKYPASKQFSKYTRTASTLHGSRLDRFYVSLTAMRDTKDILYLPVSFSDHFSVHLIYTFIPTRTAYWIFSNHLLNNRSFNRELEDFWIYWRSQKSRFPNISTWWDMGKVYIKSLAIESFSEAKYPAGNLTKEFNKIAFILPDNPQLHNYFISLKNRVQSQLRKYSVERLAQAKVGSNQIGTNPTREFFKSIIERKQLKELEYVKDNNGELLTGKDLESYVTNYFTHQFSDNLNTVNDINYLRDMPSLSEIDKSSMDGDYSLQEILASVNSLNRNTAPGLDGLTSEFYIHFKRLLMPDLLEVFNSTYNTNRSFPMSWTRQVIKLIPKAGDNQNITNWRPVTLCTNDYKIAAKLVSNRLKFNIGSLVHFEQSYCIPDRTIYDNIMTAKFMFDFHDKMNFPLALVSIDQSKAFDNVSHDYLFKILTHFNFPESFINIIKKLYTNSTILIKHKGKLLSNIKFSKGIRQGCPLSGMLYSLVIETFLFNLRKNLNNLKVQLPFSDMFFSSVNYADDILLFINNTDAFPIISDSIQRYGEQSGASVNYLKSSGLWCGSWRDRQDNPLAIQWSNEHIKYLGLFIGRNDTDLNDKLILDKLHRSLSAWRNRLKLMSLRSRVLVLNYLIASSIYHILKVHTPHTSILKVVQGKILSAFWYGRRWLTELVLYRPMNEGGLGLSNILTKAIAFQLKNFQKIFTLTDTSFSKLFLPLISQIHPNLGFNLIYIQPKPPFPDVWTDSVISMVVKWTKYRSCFMFDPSLIAYEELSSIPIWNNPDVRDLASGETLNIPLLMFTCATFGGVLDRHGNPKIPLVDLGSRMLRDIVRGAYDGMNSDSVKDSREALVLRKKSSISFLNITSRMFYDVVLTVVLIVYHFKEKWKRYIDYDFELIKPNIKMFYYPPALSADADIAFKLLHHSLPHPNQTSHFNPQNTRDCLVCHGDDGTLYHRFFTCPALEKIKMVIEMLIKKITPAIRLNPIKYLIGPKTKSRDNNLISFVLTTSKASIHEFFCDSSRIHNDVNVASETLMRIFVSKLKKRINLEFIARKEESFNNLWGSLAVSHNNALMINF